MEATPDLVFIPVLCLSCPRPVPDACPCGSEEPCRLLSAAAARGLCHVKREETKPALALKL